MAIQSTVYSNPRMRAVVEDYPWGFKQRTQATYEVEVDSKRGERVKRICVDPKTGRPCAPSLLTYARRMRIVDGDDSRIYILEDNGTHITVTAGNLKTHETVFPQSDPDRFTMIIDLFATATDAKEETMKSKNGTVQHVAPTQSKGICGNKNCQGRELPLEPDGRCTLCHGYFMRHNVDRMPSVTLSQRAEDIEQKMAHAPRVAQTHDSERDEILSDRDALRYLNGGAPRKAHAAPKPPPHVDVEPEYEHVIEPSEPINIMDMIPHEESVPMEQEAYGARPKSLAQEDEEMSQPVTLYTTAPRTFDSRAWGTVELEACVATYMGRDMRMVVVPRQYVSMQKSDYTGNAHIVMSQTQFDRTVDNSAFKKGAGTLTPVEPPAPKVQTPAPIAKPVQKPLVPQPKPQTPVVARPTKEGAVEAMMPHEHMILTEVQSVPEEEVPVHQPIVVQTPTVPPQPLLVPNMADLTPAIGATLGSLPGLASTLAATMAEALKTATLAYVKQAAVGFVRDLASKDDRTILASLFGDGEALAEALAIPTVQTPVAPTAIVSPKAVRAPQPAGIAPGARKTVQVPTAPIQARVAPQSPKAQPKKTAPRHTDDTKVYVHTAHGPRVINAGMARVLGELISTGQATGTTFEEKRALARIGAIDNYQGYQGGSKVSKAGRQMYAEYQAQVA